MACFHSELLHNGVTKILNVYGISMLDQPRNDRIIGMARLPGSRFRTIGIRLDRRLLSIQWWTTKNIGGTRNKIYYENPTEINANLHQIELKFDVKNEKKKTARAQSPPRAVDATVLHV